MPLAYRRRWLSPTPNGVDDLYDIAIGKAVRGMPASRHDGLIDLDSDAASAKTVAFQQFGDGWNVVEGLGLAIELDLHVAAVPWLSLICGCRARSA
jgi:hypothetical protein